MGGPIWFGASYSIFSLVISKTEKYTETGSDVYKDKSLTLCLHSDCSFTSELIIHY